MSDVRGALLVAALVTPLVAAMVAFLIPSGGSRSSGGGRRPRRKLTKRRSRSSSAAATDEAGSEVPVGAPDSDGAASTPSPPPVPDPLAAERAGMARRTVVRVASLTSAGLWIALSLLGEVAAGPARAVGAVAPAAAGAALLLAASGGPARRFPAAASVLALGLASAGLALGVGDDGAAWVVAGLTGACVLIALAGRAGGDVPPGSAALALAGAATVTAGLARVVATTGALELPVDGLLALDAGLLLVGGSAVVAVVGALRPRRSAALLLPVALAIGVPSATTLGAAGDAVALALVLLALAATVGWAATSAQFPDARLLSAALALAALAAAAVPTSGIPGTATAVEGAAAAGVPAAWLLATAAVVTAVSLVPLAGLCAIPGVAALTVVLVADPEPARLALAGLAVATVVAAVAAVGQQARGGVDDRPRGGASAGPQPALGPLLAAVPALALGAWVLVVPTSWTWVGPVRLEGWSYSVALGAAGGLIAMVAAAAAGRLALPRPPLIVAPDPVSGPHPGASGWLVAVAGVAVGLALLALLASA